MIRLRRKRVAIVTLGLLGLLCISSLPAAPRPNTGLKVQLPGKVAKAKSTEEAVGLPMQIVLMFTGLTVLPAVVMSLTPFLRITLVLHFLRQAIGTQSAPSNPVLVGLGLFLTVLIMNPVLSEIQEKAWKPYESGQTDLPARFDWK